MDLGGGEAFQDLGMDEKQAKERSRDRNEWRIVVRQI